MRRPGVVPDGVAWGALAKGWQGFRPARRHRERARRTRALSRAPALQTAAHDGYTRRTVAPGVFRVPCAVRRAPRAWRPPPVKHIHGVRHNTSCAFGVRVSAHPPFKARAQLAAWAKASTGERA